MENNKNRVNGNNNIVANGDITEINNFSPSTLYIFNIQVMADIINAIYDSKNDITPLNDFEVVDDIKIKNMLNKIEDGFFNDIIKPYYDEFGKLDAFFKNPRNKDIAQKYKSILTEVRGRIYCEISDGKKLQNILPTLFDYAKQKRPDLFIGDNLHYLNLLAYYMYTNCDIGKKND
ncbi:MAG: hypothetical protein J1F71_04390 [Clostridiales bacterium]|nr:hypothetical protein [Clostridiales bacterium]